MQAIGAVAGNGGAMGANRVLRPLAALKALRPVRLTNIADLLNDWRYCARVLYIVATYLPEHVQTVRADWGRSFDMTERFLQVVNEHLFPVAFDLVNDYIFSYGMDEEEERHPYELAVEIVWPEVYGLTNETGMNENALQSAPGMWLLQEMFLNGRSTADLWDTISLQAKVELILRDWSDWDEMVTLIQDWDCVTEPLCWVPELINQAMGQTGNFFLDSSWFDECLIPGELTWCRQDVEMLTRSWELARPELEKQRRFNKWCEQPENFQKLLDALGIKYVVRGKDE